MTVPACPAPRLLYAIAPGCTRLGGSNLAVPLVVVRPLAGTTGGVCAVAALRIGQRRCRRLGSTTSKRCPQPDEPVVARPRPAGGGPGAQSRALPRARTTRRRRTRRGRERSAPPRNARACPTGCPARPLGRRHRTTKARSRRSPRHASRPTPAGPLVRRSRPAPRRGGPRGVSITAPIKANPDHRRYVLDSAQDIALTRIASLACVLERDPPGHRPTARASRPGTARLTPFSPRRR
jgi:hypothetical protein